MKPEQLELFAEKESKKYKIPGRTENPAVTGKMCDRWIRDFCKMNNLSLPKYYHSKTARQKRGMFYGMLRTYNISLDDIIVD